MVVPCDFSFFPASIQIDPANFSTVTSWPVPDSNKQLQSFLEFVNRYCQLIGNYSSVASLTTLISNVVPFQCTHPTEEAFQSPGLPWLPRWTFIISDKDSQSTGCKGAALWDPLWTWMCWQGFLKHLLVPSPTSKQNMCKNRYLFCKVKQLFINYRTSGNIHNWSMNDEPQWYCSVIWPQL